MNRPDARHSQTITQDKSGQGKGTAGTKLFGKRANASHPLEYGQFMNCPYVGTIGIIGHGMPCPYDLMCKDLG